jgi:DNA-directed RNA polymerase sigma subunit (sigma70/sigma32)
MVDYFIGRRLGRGSAAARRLGIYSEMVDVVAAGMYGLWLATGRYDPDRPVRFMSFAQYPIWRAARGEVVDTARGPHVCWHTWQLTRDYLRAAERCGVTGVPPVDTIVNVTGWSPRRAACVRDALRTVALPVYSLDERLDEWRGVSEPCRPTAPPSACHDAEDDPARADRIAAVRAAVDSLTPRRRQAVIWRFGLDGGGPQPYHEIARRSGVTRQCAHLTVRSALNRLYLTLAARGGGVS